MMVTGTNFVQEVTLLYRIGTSIDNNGYWNHFGSRSDCALIELPPYFDNMVTGTKFIPHLTMPEKFNVILIMMVTDTGTNLELLSYFDNDDQWDQFGTIVDHAIEVQNS